VNPNAGAQPRRRLEFWRLVRNAYTSLDQFTSGATEHLDPALVDLVCLRTAQINRCNYCLDMHTKDALHHGDTVDRLVQLSAWQDSSCFSDSERAALAITDALTNVSTTGVPDDVWETASAEFDERELACLIATIVSSNAWNRVNIAIREPAGSYTPVERAATPPSSHPRS
jgi:AhpD family alkylhydroperoxidase